MIHKRALLREQKQAKIGEFKERDYLYLLSNMEQYAVENDPGSSGGCSQEEAGPSVPASGQ
jgi:hypothetical protein